MIEGHEHWVSGALELRNRQILSWSSDKAMRLWSTDGDMLKVMEGHERGVLELHDGRLLSWSDEGTLRLWSMEGENQESLAGQRYPVTRIAELKNGNVMSAGGRTVTLWSRNGELLKVIDVHERLVNDVIVLHDDRIVSCADGRTLRFGVPKAIC